MGSNKPTCWWQFLAPCPTPVLLSFIHSIHALILQVYQGHSVPGTHTGIVDIAVHRRAAHPCPSGTPIPADGRWTAWIHKAKVGCMVN